MTATTITSVGCDVSSGMLCSVGIRACFRCLCYLRCSSRREAVLAFPLMLRTMESERYSSPCLRTLVNYLSGLYTALAHPGLHSAAASRLVESARLRFWFMRGPVCFIFSGAAV